ncbi:MAG TPA: dTDP-4-dehydrorhamnose reductase, partial [Candidatus Saccharimonadales bacterium]|nr:dTDP-4-dehydrorhamnose reductase [Candidatus Saccharimonadales bacterium]
EQLRWLMEVWHAASRLRQEGCDVRAVTAWSLLGAYDWNTLLTRFQGYYEPGAFDLRSPRPRPTALASCIRSLAKTGDYHHPVLHQEGWWRRSTRLLYPAIRPIQESRSNGVHHGRSDSQPSPPLLITGATGTLGQAFHRLCGLRGLPCRLVRRQEMDIACEQSVERLLDHSRPWAVINTAGYVRVDDAEQDAATCFRENTAGPLVLAKACAARGIPFVTFSSDLVFDGAKQAPYLEGDAVTPLNVYGRSKAEAERQILEFAPRSLVIRTSAFFGPWDDFNFVTLVRKKLKAGQTVSAASDAVISPTYVPDLVHATLDLLIDGETGLWHLANQGAMSWADLAVAIAHMAELPRDSIVPVALDSLGYPARRPRYSVLSSSRGLIMPSFQDALSRYCEECADISEERTAPVEHSGCSNRSQSESRQTALASEDVSL